MSDDGFLTRRRISELLATHGLRPSRALGQNFVADPNTVRRIARLAGVGPGDRVVEIGPGLGSLTLALAATGAHVTAVEIDRYVLPVLRDVVAGRDVRVIEGDALTLAWAASLEPARPPWVLVANLPYNIATPLVMEVLDGVQAVTRLVVMVQREVGERLAAGVGDAGYGAVSVRVAWHATAKVVGRVPASVFVPQPRVESALVALERRDTPGDVDRSWFDRLLRAGFATRRKMLRGALGGLVDATGFEAAGIRPEARAEELTLHDWCRLARCAPSPS